LNSTSKIDLCFFEDNFKELEKPAANNGYSSMPTLSANLLAQRITNRSLQEKNTLGSNGLKLNKVI